MTTLKLLHIGDMHIDYDPKFKTKIEPSLKQLLPYCKEIKINAVIIPGDLTHRKQSYSNSSGVPMLLNFLKDLSQLVDFIFITKGNHDEAGSIQLLNQLEHNIYAFEYPVCLGVHDISVVDLLRSESVLPINYIVSLIPYPTKSAFLSDQSIDNNNSDFIQQFEQVFELIGDVTQPYACPKILGFHGNVVGSRLSSGQTLMSQDIMVAPSTLEKANADYYALNHIHLRQVVKPNMLYAGGIANFNWGETEQKSVEVIEYVGREFTTDRIMLTSARPMVTVEAEFTPGMTSSDFFWEGKIDPSLENFANVEFRFRCKVKEGDRNLLTDDKIQWLKTYFGEDVKLEFNIIPAERESRSEQIMNCHSLLQEVEEFASIVNETINETIENKVTKIQEELL